MNRPLGIVYGWKALLRRSSAYPNVRLTVVGTSCIAWAVAAFSGNPWLMQRELYYSRVVVFLGQGAYVFGSGLVIFAAARAGLKWYRRRTAVTPHEPDPDAPSQPNGDPTATLDFHTGGPPRPKRWIPVSLKLFLMILVTTVVVGFSWTGLHHRRQQLIMKKVEMLGGRIMVDNRMSSRLRLREILGPERLGIFDEVCGIDLNFTKATDDDLAELARLGGLLQVGYLGLDGTQVTDEGLRYLRGMRRVWQLKLCGTRITDDGLRHVEGMTALDVLYLSDTEISDAALENLEVLRSLSCLVLNQTGVTDAGMAHLTGLKKLQLLAVLSTSITDDGVAELQKHLPNLAVLR